MDKSVLSIVSLDDPSDEVEFWLSRTPEERVEGIEVMRQHFYGYDPAHTGLQAVLEVVELGKG